MTHHQQAGREKLTRDQRICLKFLARYSAFETYSRMSKPIEELLALGLVGRDPKNPSLHFITPLGRRTLSEAQT